MFWDSAMDVKSRPLRSVSFCFENGGNGCRDWERERHEGGTEVRGGKGEVPNEPDETFCRSMLLRLELIEDEFLDGFGFEGCSQLSVSNFLSTY
jgi:hypothetical protein